MGTREDVSAIRHRARLVTGAVVVLAAGLSACGSSDFANDPRPPVPIEITANVTPDHVLVSPNKVGGGLANFTISNQSDSPVRFTLVGPAPQDNLATNEIPPGGVGNLKASLAEGDYSVTAGSRAQAKPDTLVVGAERKSSQNDLLLP
jgi:hypothetical protein